MRAPPEYSSVRRPGPRDARVRYLPGRQTDNERVGGEGGRTRDMQTSPWFCLHGSHRAGGRGGGGETVLSYIGHSE